METFTEPVFLDYTGNIQASIRLIQHGYMPTNESIKGLTERYSELFKQDQKPLNEKLIDVLSTIRAKAKEKDPQKIVLPFRMVFHKEVQEKIPPF